MIEILEPSFFESPLRWPSIILRRTGIDIAVIEVGSGRKAGQHEYHPALNFHHYEYRFDHMNFLGNSWQKSPRKKPGSSRKMFQYYWRISSRDHMMCLKKKRSNWVLRSNFADQDEDLWDGNLKERMLVAEVTTLHRLIFKQHYRLDLTGDLSDKESDRHAGSFSYLTKTATGELREEPFIGPGPGKKIHGSSWTVGAHS